MGKRGVFNLKAITGVLAAVFFLTGFLFVDRGNISGNTIIGSYFSFNPISFIGLVLVGLGIVLAFYSVKR